ncbi:MAG: hypothetical protein MUE62_07825, partial [Burkholderiaceae bacterium]|nr:hypothetical protein [Burkholderiaceae bacterium]
MGDDEANDLGGGPDGWVRGRARRRRQLVAARRVSTAGLPAGSAAATYCADWTATPPKGRPMNRLTELLGTALPIIQAPMAGV